MYNNIGAKIKVVAVILFILNAITVVIMGLILIEESPLGVVILFFGPVVSWILSLLMYGFGELIDKICDIEKNTRKADEPIGQPKKALAKDPIIHDTEPGILKPIVVYWCKSIIATGEKGRGTCAVCKKQHTFLERCMIKTELGTRDVSICADCKRQFVAAAEDE